MGPAGAPRWLLQVDGDVSCSHILTGPPSPAAGSLTMYEDGWFSLVSEQPTSSASTNGQSRVHRRKESLLQQPNGVSQPSHAVEALENVYEEVAAVNDPAEPTLLQRSSSYSDFYRMVRAQLAKDANRRRRKTTKKTRAWDALLLNDKADAAHATLPYEASRVDLPIADLVGASQQKYRLYHDQLELTERHLGGLIGDADSALALLTSLSDTFKSVETQTSTFQSQCEDVLNEQRRLETLAKQVETDYARYDFVDSKKGGANAVLSVRDSRFGAMLDELDANVAFIHEHEGYLQRDTYLARYESLLSRSLRDLDFTFTSRLQKIASDIGRQVGVNHTESARHALAYGRFEELMFCDDKRNRDELILNIHQVVRRVYDQYGKPIKDTCVPSFATQYVNATNNMFHSWFTTRDKELKLLTQHDVEEFQKDVGGASVETACRTFIKQTFERVYDEDRVFSKIFDTEPFWSASPDTAFQALKAINTTMAHPANLSMLANHLQTSLQGRDLDAICSIVGWLAHEYSVVDDEDDESPFQAKSRGYAAQLLVDYLWPFADRAFEAEVAKSITKATVQDSELAIRPAEDGVASSNAYPTVKKAMALLVQFDQSMPKDRAAQNSAVVFTIVRETIQVLQRAEARLKSLKSETDPDLFMVKNLLIIKNELVSLEIGDIRRQEAAMQHFGQIWETLSPQNLVGWVGSIIGGSLWSSRGAAPAVAAKNMTVEDMNEQLDELLRQSIGGFTKRWGGTVSQSRARKAGAKPIAKVEAQLDGMLETAFSTQQEVKARLREAVELNAQAVSDAKDGQQGAKRY